MQVIGRDIEKALTLLRNGEVVAIPTETVYGLAANALNEEAVLKIFEIKNRPFFDPLIVHIHSLSEMEKYAFNIPKAAYTLANAFWPGPLTLILPKKELISDLISSGHPTVGLRMPNHHLTINLLKNLPFPLAAPSANPFGYISPTSAQHVANQLGEKVSYILDGGECTIGLESTIIGFDEETPVVYRLGGISIEQIEEVVGKVEAQIIHSSNPSTPGQLKSHYAPQKPLFFGEVQDFIKKHNTQEAGIIFFGKQSYADFKQQWQLSSTSDMKEAARNLFRILRKADQSPVKNILAIPLPMEGLGRAINDRLQRASTRE